MFGVKKKGGVMPKLTITVLGSLLLPGVAIAHPGHEVEFGLVHYLTDPFHAGAGILVVAIGVFLVVLCRRRASSLEGWTGAATNGWPAGEPGRYS